MATERLQVYKCKVCSDMVEVLRAGSGSPSCCGQPMELLNENVTDASREKHVPVIERTAAGVRVKVGAVPHPMEAVHFIEWIELLADGKAYRQFLKSGDAPEAVFAVEARELRAREFCNLHGLWTGR
jgi:superoxide reductase